MLNLNGRPDRNISSQVRGTQIGGPTFLDLREHVALREDISRATRDGYLGAISVAAKVMNLPLAATAVDLAAIETRFPRDGYDPDYWSTQSAYLLFRRRLLAALREFVGIHTERARLRSMEDGWTHLLKAVEPLTEGRIGVGAKWHPMKREALKAFALVARSYGLEPRDITSDRARTIDNDFRGNKRDANRRSLLHLDELRVFPSLLPLLPDCPIGFVPEHRVPLLQSISPVWEAQIIEWIGMATQTGWDPVEGRYVDHHVGHAHVMKSALRSVLRIGLELGDISHDDDLKNILSDDDIIRGIAAEMFGRKSREAKDGRLAPRTSWKYLKVINQLRGLLGIDTTLMSQILTNNAVARQGRREDKCMTPKNRKFCESLVNKPHLRKRFLLSFQLLKAAAEAVVLTAKAEERELTVREVAHVRLLGTSACFAAIAIGGAPIRVKNAMMLTCTGEDAQIRVPASGRGPIEVRIPAGLTKNKKEIAFPITYHASGYYDTIRWYLTRIRPLFPHAASSPYLFPSVRTEQAHLGRSNFGTAFSEIMRSVVDLPMTPHQMRHGQTSLLLDAHPLEIDVIAKRIDDRPETLRTYYGWLDELKRVERGQTLLIGLM